VSTLPLPLLPRNVCVPAPSHGAVDVAAVLQTNLSGVNLDGREWFGSPPPDQLGNLGWIRLNYDVSAGTGSIDLEAAYNRYHPLLQQYTRSGYKTIVVLTHQTYGEGRAEFLPWQAMTRDKWRQLSDQLAVMACEIARQYAGQGIVTVYQIWNEQDARIGARSSVPMTAENYAYMVTQVAQAIRAADPDALIITGGHVGVPGKGDRYAQQVLQLLPSQTLIDGIAFHAYGRGVGFDSSYGTLGSIDTSIQAYRQVLPDKPIWITEWGVLDRSADPSPQVAAYAMDMLNYVDEHYGDDVAAMVWYAWSQGMDNGYGLVDGNQTPRSVLYEQFTGFLSQR